MSHQFVLVVLLHDLIICDVIYKKQERQKYTPKS